MSSHHLALYTIQQDNLLCLGADPDDGLDDGWVEEGGVIEGTIMLRWERLVGRLCARLAQKRLQLLLFWVHLQLAFTEGCSTRMVWLSDKVRGQRVSSCALGKTGQVTPGDSCLINFVTQKKVRVKKSDSKTHPMFRARIHERLQ